MMKGVICLISKRTENKTDTTPAAEWAAGVVFYLMPERVSEIEKVVVVEIGQRCVGGILSGNCSGYVAEGYF